VPSVPVRTCVGCRERCPRADLVRVVLSPEAPGVLVVDEAARLPGRGAWVHSTPSCLTTALRRGALCRALRWDGPLDATALDSVGKTGQP
jgi:predicted RNA-binding protein YlxR (DUF448 family)